MQYLSPGTHEPVTLREEAAAFLLLLIKNATNGVSRPFPFKTFSPCLPTESRTPEVQHWDVSVRFLFPYGGRAGPKYGAFPGVVWRHARHIGSRGAAGLQREASDHVGMDRGRKGRIITLYRQSRAQRNPQGAIEEAWFSFLGVRTHESMEWESKTTTVRRRQKKSGRKRSTCLEAWCRGYECWKLQVNQRARPNGASTVRCGTAGRKTPLPFSLRTRSANLCRSVILLAAVSFRAFCIRERRTNQT